MASVMVKRYLYIFLTFIFASVAAMGTYQVLMAKPGTKSVTVFVAQSDIPARTAIGQPAVVSKQFPMAFYPDAAADPVGKVTKVGVVRGEVIINGMLTHGSGSGLSAQVPAGMFAMSISINQVTGVNGAILPGDRVDLITATSGGVTDILPGVLVLDKTPSVLTIEVSQTQGLAVIQAEQHGSLTVLLRGIAND